MNGFWKKKKKKQKNSAVLAITFAILMVGRNIVAFARRLVQIVRSGVSAKEKIKNQE